MSARRSSSQAPHPERGAVLVLVAISMTVLLGFAALALDLGHLYVTRNEVQNVADGVALAGARALGGIYQGLTPPQQQTFTCDTYCAETILTAAQAVAANNRAGGLDMTVRVEDVEIGTWRHDTFTVASYRPDAVRVIARRDEVANGPVASFFGRALGVAETPVNALAIAAMTGQGTVVPGEVELPIGVSRWFFDNRPDQGYCDEDIQFYPSNDPASCAGWTSWEYNSNDATLRKILDQNPNFPGPGAIAGETIFNFTGGTLSTQTFDALLSLFQRKGSATNANGDYLVDASGGRVDWQEALSFPGAVPMMEMDNKGNLVQAKYPDGSLRYLHRWDTTVPVYDRGDCSNPNQSILIVGFAQVKLTDVLNAPSKLVRGKLLCNLVSPEDNRGGGGEYGLKGPIPGLVR